MKTYSAIEYWKNFNLGTELTISGSFIYNGIKAFDEMEIFYHEEEIFEFLYNISVGIERLEKVLIILSENDANTGTDQFEEKLKTHNHIELFEWVVKNTGSQLPSIDKEFLHLLTNFYKNWRYDRYLSKEFAAAGKEKDALNAFIEKHRQITISNQFLNPTKNEYKTKKLIGEVIGRISNTLYELICKYADSKGLYTYEIQTHTKAYKIFLRKEYDFEMEDILWKETLLYCIQNSGTDKTLKFLSENIECLDFDPADIPSLICSLKNDILRQKHIEMLDSSYEEIEKKSERIEFMKAMTDLEYLSIDDDDDCD